MSVQGYFGGFPPNHFPDSDWFTLTPRPTSAALRHSELDEDSLISAAFETWDSEFLWAKFFEILTPVVFFFTAIKGQLGI